MSVLLVKFMRTASGGPVYVSRLQVVAVTSAPAGAATITTTGCGATAISYNVEGPLDDVVRALNQP